jgi:hypothetical protein
LSGQAPQPKTTVEQAKAAPARKAAPVDVDSDEDDLSYFSKLAEED